MDAIRIAPTIAFCNILLTVTPFSGSLAAFERSRRDYDMPLSGFEVVLAGAVFLLAILLGQGVGRRAGFAAVVWGARYSHSRLKTMTLSKLPNFDPTSVYVCGRSGIAIDDNMRKLAVTQGHSSDILDPQIGLEYRTEERRLAGWDWYYICLRKNGREFAIPFQDPGVRDEWVRKIVSL